MLLLRPVTQPYMVECYALTTPPLPEALHGADADFSIRAISESERISIEDYFFSRGVKLTLDRKTTAIVVPQNHLQNAGLEDFAVLIEFALGILTVSGFQPVTMVAILNASMCTDAAQRSYPEAANPPRFPKKLVKSAACTWLRHFFAARRRTKDSLHIAADRFVRYLRMGNSRDALVDLCICLESLIEAQTEISFRFATCLAKITGRPDAEAVSELLSDLYDFRSKVVHGTDPTKQHKKVTPKAAKLRLAARTILIEYILYMTAHSKAEWREYLRSSLFR